MNKPADHLVQAADVSVYTGPVSHDQWAAAKAKHHIELAIVGSWHGSRSNEYAEATLHAARKAGLMTATYVVVIDKPSAIGYGLEACGNEAEHLSFVALDIEVRGVTEKSIADSIRDVHAGSHRAAIYTGAWFWQGRLGNPKWAPHIPALGLELRRPPDTASGTTSDTAAGKVRQLSDISTREPTTELGFSCDLSVFDKEVARSEGTA